MHAQLGDSNLPCDKPTCRDAQHIAPAKPQAQRRIPSANQPLRKIKLQNTAGDWRTSPTCYVSEYSILYAPNPLSRRPLQKNCPLIPEKTYSTVVLDGLFDHSVPLILRFSGDPCRGTGKGTTARPPWREKSSRYHRPVPSRLGGTALATCDQLFHASQPARGHYYPLPNRVRTISPKS